MRRSSLTRLYPKRWRRRYGEEFQALLDDEPFSLSLVRDVLTGALGAHLASTLEEPMLSTRRIQAASAFLALTAIVTGLFVLAAAGAKELLVNQAILGAGSATRPGMEPFIERGLVIAAGSGAALVLGVVALGWRLRNRAWLRTDLVLFVRLLRRLALTVGLIAVICAFAVLIVVPAVLIVSR
jgi:hypothetical protein